MSEFEVSMVAFTVTAGDAEEARREAIQALVESPDLLTIDAASIACPTCGRIPGALCDHEAEAMKE